MSASIMQAFNTALSTFAATKSISVAWENTPFSPTPGTPYLMAYLIPSATVAAAVGPSARNRHRGHFQVNVVYPADTSWGACAAMAEDVRKNFKRGTKLMSGYLIITTSYTIKGQRDGSRYTIPVSISYEADLVNE